MELPPFDDMFKQIETNFRICGIHKSQRLGLKFLVLYLALALMIIEESAFLCTKFSAEHFLELTALLPCTGIGILSILKFSFITLKRRQIFDLMKKLKDLYEVILSDPVQRSVVRNDIVLVWKLTKCFFILNAILISVFNFSTPIIIACDYLGSGNITLIVPYAVVVPFSIDIWYNWIVVYIHSISAGFICVLYFTAVDALYYNLSSHVCANFLVLNHELKNIKASDGNALSGVIKKHQYLLQLCDELEDIFTSSNLFNVLIGSIEICALGFNIMTAELTRLPGFILFISSILCQIFLMSHFGENIMRESLRVSEAAYLCKWYEMDQRYKKMILFLMTRANKAQCLTAYKFSSISYPSFSKIISTSWSYFTILRTVYSSSDLDTT